MNIPQCGIKLHSGNFTVLDQPLQPYLTNGDLF
ncbi:TPA: DNA base-flipping protein [Klebsiella pneumoniae]|nr:DNA base-flipping protein [Klebsiella pneumoniae]HBX8482783.1 DNA base-flipping protein [Klebsiella pneumoniae]HBX8488202.1 DNA base-flipping protein [Klebsiella pneumoniae]HBX8493690.1 DNA base-flipping protein [Klebsiella pneumoniae]